MRVAGIDIGTLTCRLLVAEVSPEAAGPLRAIRSERKILRLGEGVDRTGRLKPEAMSRVTGTIREWKTIIERHGVERYTAVATSAVREAGNREEFLERVRRETAVEVEVIDGEEEARRTFLGIRSGLPDVGEILGLDIGGGSTEFIASRPGKPLMMTSIDMGVVRLTERVLRGDPPRAEEIHKAETLIRDLTRKARREIGDVTDLTLVGTAGTITSLAAIAQQLPTYDPSRIQKYVLELPVIRRIERDVFGKMQLGRVGMPGLEAGREGVIAAGVLILRCAMEELNARGAW
ncbi:MAG: Ppx/GppA phosphatase family protein [Nitrospira sp.]|nr:Ppx/GppA phosphatase family protein [Nitrospira sp.]